MVPYVPITISLVLIAFWLWMFVDMANNEYIAPESKNTWFVLFVFLNIFTALWYYAVEYRNRHL
jgi:hypothetical protein